jgi:hypothetical protein
LLSNIAEVANLFFFESGFRRKNKIEVAPLALNQIQQAFA